MQISHFYQNWLYSLCLVAQKMYLRNHKNVNDFKGHCLPVIIRFSIWMNTVTEQPYYSPTRNRHYRGCQDNQPWFTEPQIGLHLRLEALAMRLSRCCASQPITGEIEEKDDIIGKLGQTVWIFWLSSPLAYEAGVIFVLSKIKYQ